MTALRVPCLLYVLALILVGIGYLGIMPAFEGFDERAHYSSMREMAVGSFPVLGESFVDQAFDDYTGPRPNSNVFTPPFNVGPVYSNFFSHPELIAPYRSAYREASFPKTFRPSKELNWQAQHPPLYYALMAPLVNAVGPLSFVTQFFVLRFASYLLAVAGVVFGLLAVRESGAAEDRGRTTAGFFLYPLVFPMFFPEFTRLGNDSLCLALVGLLALLLARFRRDETNIRISFAIGSVLSLGLLTKALFLPITAALGCFLFFRLWREEAKGEVWMRRRLSLLAMFYPALLVGGVWYLSRLSDGGDLSGGVDSILLAKQGGLIEGLKAHFSTQALFRSILVTLSTFSWGGTQSLAGPSWPLRTPMLVLLVVVCGAYLSCVRHKKITDYAWMSVWFSVFFGASLFYHILIGLGLNGMGQTPGWYAHVLMPVIAPALGIGVGRLMQMRMTKPFVFGLLLYAFTFQVMMVWSQIALFTGCATKGDNTFYVFPGRAFCLDQAPALLERLAVLGYPWLAALGFGGGMLCALALILPKPKQKGPEGVA